MKRRKSTSIFLTVLLVLALFMFSGCGNDKEVVPDTPNQTNDMNDDSGVMDGVENDINKGVDDMKDGVNDMTDGVTSPGSMNDGTMDNNTNQ